jgi:acyl-CoA synthetase (AMP-forming)/AMP-acid ligase II
MPGSKNIIFESDYPKPYLPRSSVFHHLFPDETSQLPTYDPKLPAYIDGLDGRVLSRGELKERALRVVSGLRAVGFQRGDAACLWGANSLEWATAIYGSFAAGAVVSPANVA